MEFIFVMRCISTL